MDLSISPDLEAYYCYLLVFLIGLIVAWKRVAELLSVFQGVLMMRDTWLLLAVYTLVPVVLFWLLDRAGALHDTSLFGAILVAVGYRQIIAGGVQGLAAPSQVSRAWQPLVEWTDRVAARIRDRIQRHTARYEERVVSRLVRDPAKLAELTRLVQNYTASPAAVQTQLDALAAQFAVLGPAGVARKQAVYLYQSLKAAPNLDHEYLMYQQGITSRGQYLWYAREWRSKALAGAVGLAALAAGLWLLPWFQTPENTMRYYVWRLQKPTGTAWDRHRARGQIGRRLREEPGAKAAAQALCAQVTGLLRYEALPVETAESLLSLLVEHRAAAFRQQVPLPLLLAEALRTSNPDLRARVQKALLLLALDRGKSLPEGLGEWGPSKQDSMKDVEDRIRQWGAVWGAGMPVATSRPSI